MRFADFGLQFINNWLFVTLILISILSLFGFFIHTQKKKIFFLILRIFIFLFLFFILLQPTWTVRERLKQKPTLPVLVDISGSMSLPIQLDLKNKNSGDNSRFFLFKNFLSSKALENLGKRYNLSFFTFSDTIRPSSLDDILKIKKPKGKLTDLTCAIQNMKHQVSKEKLAGVLLLSDGAHNTTGDPHIVAKKLGVPIISIGIGELQGFKDLQITKIYAPDFAFRNRKVEITVAVRNEGFIDKNISIILKKDKNIIQTKKIRLRKKEENIIFSFIPKEVGTFFYTVTIPQYEGEISHKNNSKSLKLKVIRDKIRILLICGQPGWEYSFLRRSLKNNPNLELVSFVILRNPQNVTLVSEDQLSLIPFPVHEIFTKEIFNFDLLIFENFTYTRFFQSSYLTNIKKFVLTGGAFIMIGGDNSFGRGRYGQTAIEDILPVTLEGYEEKICKGLFKMQVGKINHPIVKLGMNPEQNNQIWKIMPELDGCNSLKGLKPNAISLGSRIKQQDKSVILAVWDKGKGRVMAMASNTTWRWSFCMAENRRSNYYYNRFWQQAIRWLVKAPELKLVKLYTDKKKYLKGESINLKIKVLDEFYRLCDDVKIRLTLKPPKGRIVNLTDLVIRNKVGEYELNYEATMEGKYLFRIRVDKEGRLLGKDTTLCKVVIPNFEFEGATSNRALLEEIAMVSGGEYFSINEVKEQMSFPFYKNNIFTYRRVNLWNSFWIYLIICSLLFLDWYMHKKFEGMQG